uniref:Uncharacterized protein n=1 Tax=Medicago truncatula TaxID=3880 RepID=I3SZ75_MEDTR|nr:unknown [Medicago truncatula]
MILPHLQHTLSQLTSFSLDENRLGRKLFVLLNQTINSITQTSILIQQNKSLRFQHLKQTLL